jgi:hypothetical protein
MRVQSDSDADRRLSRRVLSVVPAEDEVLISPGGKRQLAGKLIDISCGGALIELRDPSLHGHIHDQVCKLYFQSRGEMFVIEGELARKQIGLLAFKFINLVEEDLVKIRTKLARMEILAARRRE